MSTKRKSAYLPSLMLPLSFSMSICLAMLMVKEMLIEKERGSISEGKYADFLLVDKDVLSCPETEIHEAKPDATYFEGKKVYAMK